MPRRASLELSAAAFLPPRSDLTALREASRHCEGCPLWARATQTVFGEGNPHARMLVVGEQPGDAEDRLGRPFVGPAGHLLDRCLEDAGIDRDLIYVTNAVKHFKWEPRGKRRIHTRPSTREVRACRPWLDAELAGIEPAVIVAMGATAAQGILGRTFRLTEHRGEVVLDPAGRPVVATLHPSAILRMDDDARRAAERAAFTDDLRHAASLALASAGTARR